MKDTVKFDREKFKFYINRYLRGGVNLLFADVFIRWG